MAEYFFALAASSFVLGALHALEPGHGKTLVAAYLVGSRGRWYHAIYLGVIVTLTHTAGILALALVALYATDYLAPETVMHYMEVVSGFLIAAIGLYILIQRVQFARRGGSVSEDEVLHIKHHSEDSSHGHHHSHGGHHHHGHHSHGGHSRGHTFGGLTALGISGGIIPCPAALAVLLAAISLGHPTQGFLLVVVFSLGLASVLIALGLIVVKTASVASERIEGTKLVKWMPVVSAAIVTILGFALLLKATLGYTGVPHEHAQNSGYEGVF